MADKEQVIIEYVLQEKGGEKVIATIDDIAESSDKAGKALTSALSEKQIDSATEKLSKFNTEVEKTTTEFSSAKAELNALTKEITSGKLQGKDLELAKKRAGELKDRIGDVRSEITKLASDTRVFDTLVEGGRAVAASMSLAQGAAALFGSENKDLQKALLRTQGALALLTGAQELAKIATEQGGIATKAYGFALRAVDGIQKALAVSTAAAWGIIGIAIAGASALLGAFLFNSDRANNAQKDFVQDAIDSAEKVKDVEKKKKEKLAEISEELNDLSVKDAEQRLAAAMIAGNGIKEAEIGLSKAKIGVWQRELEEYKKNIGFSTEAYLKYSLKKKEIDKSIAEEEKRIQQVLFEIRRKADQDTEDRINAALKLRPGLEDEFNEAIKKLANSNIPIDVKMGLYHSMGLSAAQIAEEIQNGIKEGLSQPVKIPGEEGIIANFRQSLRDEAAKFQEQLTSATFQAAASAAASLSSITASAFANETAVLQEQKDRQLALVGENTKQREKIERDFAIKSAEIKRKQAIAERAFALVNIGVNTASAIVKQLAATPLPAGAPFVALIAATAALQTAAVLAQPLPEVPKFKEGVIGFKGKGTETSDENLVLISNNESVIKAKATSKYRDELQAANDLNLESFIYHKYLLPVLQKAGDADRDSSMYDDWLLRRTIKAGQEADRKNSQYIVNGILSGMRDSNRAAQRHYA